MIARRNFFVVGLLLTFGAVNAQNDFSVYNEPALSVDIDTETPWSYSFGTAHRRVVYTGEEYIFAAKNVEFSHTTSYKIKNFGTLGLGVKYKFIELFDENAHDELRITQQYSRSKKYSTVKVGHRVRLEERFEEETSFRTRYRFSVEIPLSKTETNNDVFFLVAETEALLSLAKNALPEIDQRVGISVGKGFWDNMEFQIGLEYQYEDYTHDPETDLFLLSEISISL